MGYSKQRQLILRALGSGNAHFTAEEVYTRLKADNPQLSLATVYRNLNALSDKGQVRRIRVPGGADRYELVARDHDHLVCERCGRMVDVPSADLAEAERGAEEATGAVVFGHALLYRGLCPQCVAFQEDSSPAPTSGTAGSGSAEGNGISAI